MLTKLYRAIRKDAAPVIIKVEDREYSDHPLYPVREPVPATIQVSTLTGIVDYLNTDIDGLSLDRLFCHVSSPSEVAIGSQLFGKFCERSWYIRAELEQLELPVNKWLDAETFNIALQACFVDSAEYNATDKGVVLKYISSVSAIAEAAVSDDGTSQAVAVKSGVASKIIDVLPNPVTLRPYRTFTEVEQPASKFVFRVRQENNKIMFSLTEADGGAWRSQAMANIQRFMRKAVPGLKVIA